MSGCASTGICVGDTAEELVDHALGLREQGFTALRFGPLAAFDDHALAHWDPQASIVQTIRATEALRLALGDDVDLLLDAHTMFTPAEAAYLGHALEPYRLYFYEDPIRPLNPLSLRLVRDKVNLPIAIGEQFASKWEFQPVIENELVDYLRIDMVHAGGITEAKKILASERCTGSGRRSTTRAPRSTASPAFTSTWRCRTSGSRSGWSSSRSTSSSRTRRGRRTGTWCRLPGRASASSWTRRKHAGAPPGTPSSHTDTGPMAASATTEAP